LQEFNLTLEEIVVYLELLKLGEASVLELARHTKLKRTSVYNYLNFLVQKRLAAWTKDQQGKKAIASEPENLSLQVDNEREKYKKLVNIFNEIVPELQSLKIRKPFSTQVKYYAGIEGLRKMISNSLNSHKNLYGYSCYGRNDVLGRDFMKDFRLKWVETKIYDHVICNDQAVGYTFPKEVMINEYLDLQEVRFLPRDKFYITSDIMIYNNVYAVASLDIKNPMGVEIINEEIVKTQMSLFNYMWEIAKPTKWKE